MKLQCGLCPAGCLLNEGQRGNCRARMNIDGKIRAITYGRPCSMHVDPIEKKPLYHFYPGSQALSFAAAGCNLHCKNCQNWEISQANPEDIPSYDFSPREIVNLAIKESAPIIAYTYTDPVIYYEYTYDTAVIAREKGIKNIIVTAGYINPKPLVKLCGVLDAVKIDFKFFDNDLYRQITGAALQPILDAMIIVKEQGVWLELVNLVIPTLSDDQVMIEKMCRWIAQNLGDQTPLHFSRFFPQYKLNNLPITPQETLEQAYKTAKSAGLKFVYVGNVIGREDHTYCPNDNTLVIGRQGYTITENNLLPGGICPVCNKKLPGVWK